MYQPIIKTYQEACVELNISKLNLEKKSLEQNPELKKELDDINANIAYN